MRATEALRRTEKTTETERTAVATSDGPRERKRVAVDERGVDLGQKKG